MKSTHIPFLIICDLLFLTPSFEGETWFCRASQPVLGKNGITFFIAYATVIRMRYTVAMKKFLIEVAGVARFTGNTFRTMFTLSFEFREILRQCFFCRLPVLLSDRIYIFYSGNSIYKTIAAVAVVVWRGVLAAVRLYRRPLCGRWGR